MSMTPVGAVIIYIAVFTLIRVSNRMRRKVYYGILTIENLEKYKDTTFLTLQEGYRASGMFTSEDGVKMHLDAEVPYRKFQSLSIGDAVKCVTFKIGKKMEGQLEWADEKIETYKEGV